VTFKIIWLAALALCSVIMVIKIAKSRRPMLSAFKSSLSGMASLMVINVLSTLTGVSLAVNYVTVSCVVVLGAPGALFLLVVHLLG